MRCFIVFLCLMSTSTAQSTFPISAGMGVTGWCDGMDMAPNPELGTAQTAEDCFNKCKETYDTTIAIDFWDINHEKRNEGNICWCQDACACLKPALPHGGTGTLYMEEGAEKGPSCGYNLHVIDEGVTAAGWCLGSDIKLNKTVNNQHQCYAECKEQHGSVAVDFFPERDPKGCFCQSECPCTMASLPDGGDGMLAIDETVKIIGDLCYKLKAGIGTQGWCTGMDSAPNSTLPAPTTAKECFENCKATYPSTVAVDYWDIDHPSRTESNICWCQDQCPCTMASKSDAGNGVLFVANGTVKGDSCGVNMKTVMEGNDNSICDGEPTPASEDTANMYQCQSQCLKDGFHVATYYTADDTACHCQEDCSCTKAPSANSGSGYLFVQETMSMPPMCDLSMTCGDLKTMYKGGNCCGKPSSTLKLAEALR